MDVDIQVNCEEISELINVQDIVAINHAITAPDEAGKELRLGGLSSEFEVNREEDYHHVRNPGILETLIETKLPYECRSDNNLIWLTAKIMTHIAQNQAFSEGNKRTAYITAVLFLIKNQLKSREKANYPLLNKNFTSKLQKLAVKEIDAEDVKNHMEEELD